MPPRRGDVRGTSGRLRGTVCAKSSLRPRAYSPDLLHKRLPLFYRVRLGLLEVLQVSS